MHESSPGPRMRARERAHVCGFLLLSVPKGEKKKAVFGYFLPILPKFQANPCLLSALTELYCRAWQAYNQDASVTKVIKHKPQV